MTLTIKLKELCADNNTFMLLINKRFILKKCLDMIIRKIFTSIQIREISDQIDDISKYVVMNLYIFDIVKKIRILTHLKIEMHLINNLKINILLKIDVLIFEKMILNFE